MWKQVFLHNIWFLCLWYEQLKKIRTKHWYDITHERRNWTSLAIGSQFDIMHDMQNSHRVLKETCEAISNHYTWMMKLN